MPVGMSPRTPLDHPCAGIARPVGAEHSGDMNLVCASVLSLEPRSALSTGLPEETG